MDIGTEGTDFDRIRVRKHLTYANVMATIAVLLALTGGGVAVASHLAVRSSDIVDGEVKTRDLAPSVRTKVFGTFDNGPVQTTDNLSNLLTLDLPAGNYVVIGKITAVYDSFENYECRVVASSDFDRAKPTIVDQDFDGFARSPLTMTVLHASAEPFTAALQCADDETGTAYNQTDLKLIALKVPTLSNRP